MGARKKAQKQCPAPLLHAEKCRLLRSFFDKQRDQLRIFPHLSSFAGFSIGEGKELVKLQRGGLPDGFSFPFLTVLSSVKPSESSAGHIDSNQPHHHTRRLPSWAN